MYKSTECAKEGVCMGEFSWRLTGVNEKKVSWKKLGLERIEVL